MRLLYSIGIGFYYLFLKIISLFNQKAKEWFYGRKELFTKLEEVFHAHHADENPAPVIWIHCASLGEYEQGRPIIEEIKHRFPGFKILLTFFSPSGFKNHSSSAEADFVFYLPIDSKSNARRFIKTVSPSLVIFVKYEFWYNYLNELFTNKIPVFTISAIFRPEQHFFKWWGGWFRAHLRQINRVFVQDKESAELLKMIDVNNAIVSGDTRFDRVLSIMQQTESLPFVEQFIGNNQCLVAGSTWPADEDMLSALSLSISTLKIIIAPHEITSLHIKELLYKFNQKALLYSQVANANPADYSILIIDSIGMLSKIYKYGNIAYVGGGFGVGIHNTLEAAVYGMPVLFGPNYHRFKEARELIFKNAAISVNNSEEIILEVQALLDSSEKLSTYSKNASEYVKEKAGATALVMGEMEAYLSDVMTY